MTTLSRPVTLQGHHLPSAVIRHPQSVSALLTALPKRRQGGGELRFGSRGSSRHRFAPVAKKPASSPQRTPGVKEGFPFSEKSGAHLRVALAITYAFIAAHQKEFPIIGLCQVLSVSES